MRQALVLTTNPLRYIRQSDLSWLPTKLVDRREEWTVDMNKL